MVAMKYWHDKSTQSRLWQVMLFSLVLLPINAVQAQPATPKEGRATCTCHHSADGVPFWSRNQTPCPDDYYLVGPDDPPGHGRRIRGAGGTPVIACCCPMPSKDILTDSHIYGVLDECPENSIATGGSVTYCASNCMMRCTRINTERYSLGPKRKGRYTKRRGFVLLGGWGGAATIFWEDIPEALRYAHGRAGLQQWDADGCAADPIGGVLVSKSGPLCDQFEFRELRTRSGAPVSMFPRCAAPIDPAESDPHCVEE